MYLWRYLFFGRAVTSILSQRLLHKMTKVQGSFDSSSSRLLKSKRSQETQYLLDAFIKYFRVHLSQQKLCTRKTELALEGKFHPDFHWVTSMATNADQRKWRHIRISAVSSQAAWPSSKLWAEWLEASGKASCKVYTRVPSVRLAALRSRRK